VENKRTKAAVQNLTAIAADTSDDPGIQLLQDAANNKLGQLYFEEVDLRKAVESFKRVPEGSPHGDEALLGSAWSWIKVNRPEQTIREVDRLISAHPQSPLVPEAYLLRGYALMLDKNNSAAIDALEKCLELAKGDFASEQDLKYRRQKFDQYLQQFSPTAQRIKKNALRKPTQKTLGERDELRSEFEDFSRESRDFFEFTQLVEDNKKFFRRKEQVILDAEYALAKAVKMSGSAREEKIIRRDEKKTEKLDDEIKKLEEELKELEE
jgi:tetratricopeptide (TPR) repeat protein